MARLNPFALNKPRRPGSFRPAVEALEDRALMTVIPPTIVWHVTGTLGYDIITIRPDPGMPTIFAQIRVENLSGTAIRNDTINLLQTKGFEIDALAGDDRVVNYTSKPCTIYGGVGADTLIGGAGADLIYGDG